jgi:hypothetical protein
LKFALLGKDVRRVKRLSQGWRRKDLAGSYRFLSKILARPSENMERSCHVRSMFLQDVTHDLT